jgi:sarcosine oxidase subunit gamma
MAAAGKALGLAISQIACRAAKPSNVSRTPSAKIGDAPDMVATPDGGVAALWLGPDEQLLLAPVNFDIGSALESVLRELPHSLVEVSHRQTALEVSGPRATLLLNAGCPLDFDLKAFPVGMCTRTVLAKAEIVLWRTSQDVFHVEVWRSFADYVSGFLAEIARELAS